MVITQEREGVRLVAFRKAAHTSLVNTFLSNRGEDVVRGHKSGRGRDKHTASVTVAFFRNPLARLVSAYNHFIVSSQLPNSLDKFGYQHGMDFAQFINLTLSIPDHQIDPHLRSQTHQLCEAFEEHFTNTIWIGQVENLATTSWREMRDFTGLQNTPDFVPAFNAKGHDPWPTYYTAALARKALEGRFFDDYKTWQSRLWQ